MNIEKISVWYRDETGIRRFSSPFKDHVRFGMLNIDTSLSPVDKGTRLKVRVSCSKEVEIRELCIELPLLRGTEDVQAVFLNGFQSWTESREYRPGERMLGIRPLPGMIFKLKYLGDYHFTGYPGKPGQFHSCTYTYFRNLDDSIDFYGSLNEDSGYTFFHTDLKEQKLTIEKDVAGTIVDGEDFEFEILYLRGTEEEEEAIFSRYAGELDIPVRNQTVTGWTSWYNYYRDISEEIILENLKAFTDNSVPSGIFQIDDGYETAVGDWLSVKPEFPRGMKFIADTIREKGYTPGLWLAPFLCERKANTVRDHSGWILKDARGKKVSAGWIPLWSGGTYAMDIYNEEFRDYLKEVFRTVFDAWGFGMVKLDFLYAAAMIPHHGRNRGQIMADGCRLLRELCGDRPILGCGVPLGSAFSLFEYCRIGSDVGPKWEDKLLKFFRYRERVATVNSLKSTIGRHRLGGTFFLNDPDVFILRKENNQLTENQKYTLFLLNNLFGQVVFTSDDIAGYDEPTMELYQSMFPLKQKKVRQVKYKDEFYTVRFSMEERDYLVFANLSGKDKAVMLDDGEYFRGRNYTNRGSTVIGGREIVLAPYESMCLLRLEGKSAAGTGPDHLFPGN